MPTGYTAEIEKGISFERFILTCAKAFGATIEMRDESIDTPIPNEFLPRDYHLKQLLKYKNDLNDINLLSDEYIKKEIKKEHEENIKSYEKILKQQIKLKYKYDNMYEKARKWKPPTPNHENLKQFMLEQISDSVNFDCDIEYYKEALEKAKNKKVISVEEWKKEKIKSLKENIKYHEENYQKEVDRCKKNTEWVKQIRESLKGESDENKK